MNKSEILACPFCGKPATVEIRTLKEKEYYAIGCANVACRGSAWAGDPDAVRAMSRWNERAGGRKPEPSAEAGDKHIALQGLVSRLEQELSDTKALLRFQEMHKSAEMLKDKSRLDWLLKESHIRFDTMDGCLYATCRQTIDDQMRAAEPANAGAKASRTNDL